LAKKHLVLKVSKYQRLKWISSFGTDCTQSVNKNTKGGIESFESKATGHQFAET